MTREERGAIVSQSRVALLALALFGAIAAPLPAQDAGVSGIPPGPANARGLNGSVNDPSGIGNAAKIPPLPQPNLNPIPVPQVPNPIVRSTRPAVVTSTYPEGLTVVVKSKRTRHGPSRKNGRAKAPREQANARERNHPLGDHIPTICRGC